MRSFRLYAASALLYVAIVHAGITGFSGNTCDGAVGLNVPCDGSCHSFDTRHSFRVDGGSGDHCVTMFEGAGCPNDHGGTAFMHTFVNQNGQCTNVNTGTPILSFLCSPNNICEV
ncbi:hypothetical protein C8Q74DRAFT_151987 [Fomes fomentarius]|nr:hypothetical protein C8Q74DRAFT_151987 [Fomes fomentarius]